MDRNGTRRCSSGGNGLDGLRLRRKARTTSRPATRARASSPYTALPMTVPAPRNPSTTVGDQSEKTRCRCWLRLTAADHRPTSWIRALHSGHRNSFPCPSRSDIQSSRHAWWPSSVHPQGVAQSRGSAASGSSPRQMKQRRVVSSSGGGCAGFGFDDSGCSVASAVAGGCGSDAMVF